MAVRKAGGLVAGVPSGKPCNKRLSSRRQDGTVDEVHKVTSLDETWRPGDVVFDAQGDIWVRSDHPKWVWSYPGGSTRSSHGGPVVPDGSVEEAAPCRPLVLLVRDGQAVAGRLLQG